MKKKIVLYSVFIAGLFLLAACESKIEINLPQPDISISVPKISPTPEADVTLTVMPTEAVPTEEAPVLTSLPTMMPEPTLEAVLTEAPLATPEPSPTELPELISPETEETPSPTPTEEPTPTPIPMPTINPKQLITNGWQKTVSMEEDYLIIFPELFRDSYLSKADRELFLGYTSEEDKEIEFGIYYKMKKTLRGVAEDVLAQGGTVWEQNMEEAMVCYQLQKDERMYRGILVENEYSKELLGNVFGEADWITGVMEVVFSYPADRASEYETENYSFYVVKNGEE